MMTFSSRNATPAARRYFLRTFAFMVPYVAICVAMITTDAFDSIMGRPAAWLLALAVAAPIAGHIWAMLSFMRDSDEFVRAVTAKQFIVAAGVAMALFSAWGFAESFAGAPHIEGWLIVPLFWGVFGLASAFIRSSN
ncbi:hypothetical protein JIX58_01720 [Brevundimonas diminuta]|uniref:hypothetical protein n=1 Tax=Brevundimonas TaxID=41275 RepID=UPI0019041AC1|nr:MULTISPECIES: hypothetical protein [Brevundimonas]MBK1969157.1 hypothetical protein [Brevundimonas diminuta]MBK1974461.1 hypothetical protein [Brevundimonas diminuta]MDA0744565.1 hypothetical protein [Pseudomonadota bacterium]MDA1321686.1 hypothetical protein [Pseudomonadota bacterium]